MNKKALKRELVLYDLGFPLDKETERVYILTRDIISKSLINKEGHKTIFETEKYIIELNTYQIQVNAKFYLDIVYLYKGKYKLHTLMMGIFSHLLKLDILFFDKYYEHQ